MRELRLLRHWPTPTNILCGSGLGQSSFKFFRTSLTPRLDLCEQPRCAKKLVDGRAWEMEEPTLAALPAEMLTSIFHWCNAATLARMACTSHDQHTAATSYGNERLRKLGDQTKADTQLPVLLLLQLKEARERAIDGEQRVSVARSASGSGARRGAAPFVALTSPWQSQWQSQSQRHPQPQ